MTSLITYRLGQVADVQQGYTFKPDYQGQSCGEWAYVKVADIGSPTSSKYLRKSLNYVSSQVLREMRATPFPAGSIVFPRVGAALRNNNKRILAEDCLTDDNVLVVTVRDANVCDPEYLYYWFDFHDLQDFCNSGTVPVINGRNLKLQEVPLPDIQLQRRTASVLSAWDTAIETTERLIAAKEKRFGWLQEFLINKFTKDVRCFHLGEITRCPDRSPVTSVENEVALTVRLYCRGIAKAERQAKITEKGRAYYKRFAGELLIGRQNIHNGGFGLVPHELDGAIASNAISSLIATSDAVDLKYIFHFMSRPAYYTRLEKLMGGTGQKEMSEEQLMKLQIAVPPLSTQRLIVSILEQSHREITLQKEELALLRRQKRGLMQKLLTGQWRVPVPEEATA